MAITVIIDRVRHYSIVNLSMMKNLLPSKPLNEHIMIIQITQNRSIQERMFLYAAIIPHLSPFVNRYYRTFVRVNVTAY